MRRVFVLVSIFLLALVAVRGVSAAPQGKGTSTITGVVLGPNDKPVANASVSYQVSSGSAPHIVRTDAHGRFTIAKLRADNYDVRASGAGTTKELTLHLIYAKEIPKAYVKDKSNP